MITRKNILLGFTPGLRGEVAVSAKLGIREDISLFPRHAREVEDAGRLCLARVLTRLYGDVRKQALEIQRAVRNMNMPFEDSQRLSALLEPLLTAGEDPSPTTTKPENPSLPCPTKPALPPIP